MKSRLKIHTKQLIFLSSRLPHPLSLLLKSLSQLHCVGNQLLPGSFQDPPTSRKVSHRERGRQKVQQFTLHPSWLTQQGGFPFLQPVTLPPTQNLWLEVGEGCLNLLHAGEQFSRTPTTLPTPWLTSLSDSRQRPKCILSLSLPSIPNSMLLFKLACLCAHTPAQHKLCKVSFQVIRHDFFGGGVAVSLSLI